MKSYIIFITAFMTLGVSVGFAQFDTEKVISDSFETEHFTMKHAPEDRYSAQVIADLLEDRVQNICDVFQLEAPKKIEITVYPDQRAFHRLFRHKPCPDWLVAKYYFDNKFAIVSPFQPGAYHSYDSILKIAHLSLVRAMIQGFRKSLGLAALPEYIVFGLASFAGDSKNFQRDFSMRNYFFNVGIPPFSVLLSSKDVKAFGEYSGWGFSRAMGVLIERRFGLDSFSKIAHAKEWSFEEVLGISEDAFREELNVFLKESFQ